MFLISKDIWQVWPSAEKQTLRKINTQGDSLGCELVHLLHASLSINVLVAYPGPGDGGSRLKQNSWAKAVIQLPAAETCAADKWDTSCAPAACSGSALGVFSQLNVLRIPLKREFLEASLMRFSDHLKRLISVQEEQRFCEKCLVGDRTNRLPFTADHAQL